MDSGIERERPSFNHVQAHAVQNLQRTVQQVGVATATSRGPSRQCVGRCHAVCVSGQCHPSSRMQPREAMCWALQAGPCRCRRPGLVHVDAWALQGLQVLGGIPPADSILGATKAITVRGRGVLGIPCLALHGGARASGLPGTHDIWCRKTVLKTLRMHIPDNESLEVAAC